jgi:hypothetical protein
MEEVQMNLIETECQLVDRKLQDMEINQDGIPVRFAFIKSQVESIREILDDDNEVKTDEVCIYFKSGESIIISMSFNELKQKLSE